MSSGPCGPRPGTLTPAANHQAHHKATEVALLAGNLGPPAAPQAEWVPHRQPPPRLTSCSTLPSPSEAESDICLKGLEAEVRLWWGAWRAPGSKLPLAMALGSGGPQSTSTSLKVWEEGPWEPRHPSLRNASQSLGLAGGRAQISFTPSSSQPLKPWLEESTFSPGHPPAAPLTDLPRRGLTGVDRRETARSPSCRHDSLDLELIHNCKYLLGPRC